MIGRWRRPGKEGSVEFADPPWDRDSPEWLAIDQQLGPDHLARVIDRVVDSLDLSPLEGSYSGRGSRPHRPDLMLKIVLFEMHRGRPSPACWHLDTKENVALQWLGLGIRPARSVWYEFAFRIGRFVDQWNREVLDQVRRQELTPATRAALDGTAIEANASRHRLLNERQLTARIETLEAAIVADENGAELPPRPYWMAKTAHTRVGQRQRYDQAQTILQQRLEENQQRVPSRRRDPDKIHVSPSDPEAALGMDKFRVYRPLYNVQYLRDVDSPFILAYDTYAHASDAGTLVPMMQRAERMIDHPPQQVLVDTGYVTGLDLADAEQLGLELCGPWKENDYSPKRRSSGSKPWGKERFVWESDRRQYRCPAGEVLKYKGVQKRPRSRGRTERYEIYQGEAERCQRCELKARCCPKSRGGRHLHRSEHEALIEAPRQKMETAEAKALYKLRRQTVEADFGDSKEHRHFRRMHGRGLTKGKTQTGLTVLTHNLVELDKALHRNHQSSGTNPPEQST